MPWRLAGDSSIGSNTVPNVFYRASAEDGDWRWLPEVYSDGKSDRGETKDSSNPRSLIAVVYCEPSLESLQWLRPWAPKKDSVICGPKLAEEAKAEDELQLSEHEKHQAALGIQVDGYALQVLEVGSEMDGSKSVDFLRITVLPDAVSTKLWRGSVLLQKKMMELRERWQDKNVLELGAGVGLVGLTLAATGGGGEIVVTDIGHGSSILEKNVNINFSSNDTMPSEQWDDIQSAKDGMKHQNIRAAKLDWRWDATRQRAALFGNTSCGDIGQMFDLSVGADILYECDSCAPLLQTAKRFSRELWVVQHVNRKGTLTFLQAAQSMGVKVERTNIDNCLGSLSSSPEDELSEFWQLRF